MKYPRQGAEVLYKSGENKNKVLVNPNFFPYISLSFDPNSSILKSEGHHNIKEVGFNLNHPPGPFGKREITLAYKS